MKFQQYCASSRTLDFFQQSARGHVSKDLARGCFDTSVPISRHYLDDTFRSEQSEGFVGIIGSTCRLVADKKHGIVRHGTGDDTRCRWPPDRVLQESYPLGLPRRSAPAASWPCRGGPAAVNAGKVHRHHHVFPGRSKWAAVGRAGRRCRCSVRANV